MDSGTLGSPTSRIQVTVRRIFQNPRFRIAHQHCACLFFQLDMTDIFASNSTECAIGSLEIPVSGARACDAPQFHQRWSM